MRVVAIEEHHIIPEMRSRMDLSLLPPAFRARLHATSASGWRTWTLPASMCRCCP